MAKKDIFKIDNYFIGVGVLFLIIGLTTFLDPNIYHDLRIKKGTNYSFEDWKGRTLEEVKQEKGGGVEVTIIEKPIIRPLIGISGFVLLVIGIIFRKKENKILSIWDSLDRTSEGKLRNMEVSLGLSRDFILKNLKHINAQQGAYYVYISAKDTIMDGRLLEEHVISITCSGCGNNINKKISLTVLEEENCPYCDAAIPVGELSKLRSKILSEIPMVASTSNSDMNIPIFIILLIVFWPAAVGYYLIKKGATTKKGLEQMQQFAQKNLNV